jgi:hypothetical protein
VLGIVTQSGGISSNGTGTVSVNGTVTNGAWSWTVNKWIYLDSTSGALTQTLTTVSGQYAIPVAIALSATQVYIQPMTGWVVNNPNNVSVGVKAISFSQSSGTLSIFTPVANTVITGITVAMSSAASATGATIQVGTAADTDSVMDTTSIDLMLTGNHIYDPYVSVGSTPSEYLLTVTAGGQTFSGILYVHYAVPSVFTGQGGMVALSFTQATSSPALLCTPTANAIVTKCVIVTDTAAAGGAPTCSIGVSGTVGRDMATTDSSLLTLGTYIYEPYTACGATPAAISLTITPASQTFAGRAYVFYQVP